MAEGRIEQSDVTANDIYGLATESLKKFGKAVDEENQKLSAQAEFFERITKSINTLSKKGIDQLTTSNRNLTKIVSQANANDKERMQIMQSEAKLRAKLESTIKGERDELIKLQEENRRATKAARDNAKAILDQGDAYETLKRDTNEAQLAAKKMAAQFGVNSKEAVEARKKFEMLDDELREIDTSVRDGRRNVGRYGEAIRDVRDTTLKWTAAITGAIGSLVGLFNAANSQDKINKRLAGSFDLTGEALDRTAKKVEFIARAYKTEVNEVIESANVLTNEFGIKSEKAFGLIEQGFQKGANVRGEFLEQLKEYSTQFVNVGLSAEQAIAVITQQENKGVFSDKGIDAIKEAGIRLTEMPKATTEALAAIGISGEEIQRQITSGQTTVFAATQQISKEIAKLPPNAKEVGTVLADVFGGAGEDAKGFVLTLGDVSAELGDLEDTTTDFEKAQQKIIEQFVNIKQEIGNALIPTFTFLSNNFETLVSVGGKLLAFFAIYKTRVLALRALNGKFGDSILKIGESLVEGAKKSKIFSGDLKEIGKAFKEGTKSGSKFRTSLKSLGSALKGIGFTAAIAAAWELYKAWSNIAFKTEQYEKFIKRQEAASKKGGEDAQKRADQREKQFQDEVNRINLLRSEGKKSAEEAQKEIKALTEARKRQVDSDIKAVRERKNEYLDELKRVKAAREQVFREAGGEDVVRGLAGTEVLGGVGLLDQVRELDDLVTKAQEKVSAASAKLTVYKGEQDDLTQSVIDQTISINENSKDTDDNTDSKDKNTKATKDQSDAYKELEQAIRDLEEAQTESQIDAAEDRFSDILNKEVEAARNTGVIQEKELIDSLAERYRLQVRASEDQRDFDKKKAEEEIKDKSLLAVELERIEFEHQERLRQINETGANDKQKALDELERASNEYYDNIETGEKSVTDTSKEEAEKQKQIRKELFDSLENLADQEIDKMVERSKKKQDILNQEKDAIEKNMDLLRDAANNQNAVASQSLAALEQQQAEKVRQLEEEAEKEAALEELKAAWSALNSFIDQGDNFASATAKALTGVATFKQALASVIPFFAKGTKDAPEGLAVTDEQGAEMHLDKYGNIKDFGSDDGARVKYLERGDKILTASETKARQTEMINRQLSGAAIMQSIAMNSKKQGDETLILEMRQLRKTIESKPEYSLHPLIKDGLLVGLKETKKTGSKIEHFRTLKRS